ncbi:hypothetical protein [Methylococcus sp. EFPC2]|uniref:hypothetical protein n=1 Tax=Methylococcus sp. EFPC2 TaxID=2812648 RepID=UPI0019672998|nr:hypothetical protein [Methylococcus sp. EFPC2]QSA95701.1 hypothetical protein JWZ97_10610 [Methylococcus sp. EFPC2]
MIFENRIRKVGTQATLEEIERHLLKHGYIARDGHVTDATLVPAPQQNYSRGGQGAASAERRSADWKPAKRWQKNLDAAWTQKHGKSHHGYDPPSTSTSATGSSARSRPVPPSPTTANISKSGWIT